LKAQRDNRKSTITQRKIRKSNLSPFIRLSRPYWFVIGSEQQRLSCRHYRSGLIGHSNTHATGLRHQWRDGC